MRNEQTLIFFRPYASKYQPAAQTVPAVASYTPAVSTPSVVNTPTAVYTPTTYIANPTADPGFFVQIPAGSGNYLPDVFGWERGSEYFNKWLDVPVQLRNNRVRWRTDGQNMRNGFNSASGADPNKYTDKYSNPGSYQGRKKREAEAEPQYFAT